MVFSQILFTLNLSISIALGHSNPVLSVCMSQDGNRVISGSEDKTVKVWDMVSGECVNTLEGEGYCYYFYFSDQIV